MSETLPLIILAGGIDKPPVLPEGGEGKRPLSGAKGIDIKLGGRPLIDLLIERLQASGGFGPIWIAGPVSAYGASRLGCEVIDTNESLGRNVERSMRHVSRTCKGLPLAITTCDILPEIDELNALLAEYRAHAPSDFWFPLIRVPQDPAVLGASSWKPQYTLIEAATGQVQKILPGHLLVLDPESIHRRLCFNCFEVAYRSRNRGLIYRLRVMIRHVIGLLLLQDLRNLTRFQAPLRTVTALWNGVRLAVTLRKGEITEEMLAERIRRIYIWRDHRLKYPDRKGRMPLVEGFSLAKDIDTREEAEEIERNLS
ncbi:MAG: nucleotidyltransferase family protein [Thermoanaerobaculia bacterium]|nr:nucleotidyltransferase family protein [Thermoanaerobaculia bacterium]